MNGYCTRLSGEVAVHRVTSARPSVGQANNDPQRGMEIAMTVNADLADDLREALEALLRTHARLRLGRDLEAPLDALDTALQEDSAYQDARAAFRAALESGSVLEVEQAHNRAVATAVEVGWLLATSTVGAVC